MKNPERRWQKKRFLIEENFFGEIEVRRRTTGGDRVSTKQEKKQEKRREFLHQWSCTGAERDAVPERDK